MKKSNKKRSLAVGAAVLASAMMIGGSFAYLTDGEQTTNTFTVGDVQIDLEEKAWDALDAAEKKLLVANHELALDPVIKNTGKNDAIGFLDVSTPVRMIAVANQDGTIAYEADGVTPAKAMTKLVYFKQDTDAAGTHATNFDTAPWVDMSATHGYYADAAGAVVTADAVQAALEADPTSEDYSYHYVFGYNEAIAVDASTNALFDKVQLVNVLEDQVAVDVAEDIVVKAYGIQASDIYEADQDIDLAAGATVSDENLGKIFDIFVNQRKAEGKDHTSIVTPEADTNNAEDLAGNAI